MGGRGILVLPQRSGLLQTLTQESAQLRQGQSLFRCRQGRRLQGLEALVELATAAGGADGLFKGIEALLGGCDCY